MTNHEFSMLMSRLERLTSVADANAFATKQISMAIGQQNAILERIATALEAIAAQSAETVTNNADVEDSAPHCTTNLENFFK